LRRHWQTAIAVASFVAVLTAAPSAIAAGMDPTPERLYLQPGPLQGTGLSCQDIAHNPEIALHAPYPMDSAGKPIGPNALSCMPNNVSWANMMSELGFAIAPNAFHPARTTGLGGFALSIEASYAHINADATDSTGTQYWHQGTQGSVDPTTKQFSIRNNSPDSLLQIYTLKARKGLAYGFEVTGALGYVSNTSLWVGGADIRWAVLEGFRTGVLGYLPDIAVGGGVRTLGGSPKFFLTTVGVDAQISKPIALADSAVLTPYVGAQRLYIFADSTVVNLTPTVDPVQQCGWQGNNVPGNPSAPGNTPGGVYDGSPVCKNKLSNGAPNNSDFNNQVTFQKARLARWRGIAGLNYRYEVLWLAGQFAMDLTDPSENGPDHNEYITGAKQWTVSLEAGVFF